MFNDQLISLESYFTKLLLTSLIFEKKGTTHRKS